MTSFFLIVTLAVYSASTGTDFAAVRSAAKEARAIDFFFVSRTESESMTEAEIRTESTIRVHRECGANCEYFMRRVLEHLEASVPATCYRADPDLVISISEEVSVLYSNHGHQIKIGENCYASNDSVVEIVKDGRFIFD